MSGENSVLFPAANPQASVTPAVADTTTAKTVTPETALPKSEESVTPAPSAPTTSSESTVTTPMFTGPAPETPKKKSSKTGCIVAFVLFFVLFLAFGGGIALAYFGNTSIPVFSDIVEFGEKTLTSKQAQQAKIATSIFKTIGAISNENSPVTSLLAGDTLKDQLGQKIAEANSGITSAKFDLTLSATGTESSNVPLTVSANLSGASSSKKGDEKADSTLTLKIVAEGQTIEGAAQIRAVGQSAYIKFTTIPALLSTYVDLSSVKNKWLEINPEDFSSLEGLTVTPTVGTEPASANTQENIDNIMKILNTDAIQNNFSRVSDEIMNNVRTSCYQLDMDQNDYRDFIVATNNMAEGTSKLSASEIEASVKQVNKILVKICSGRQDNLVYRLDITLDGINESTKTPLTVALSLKMWDYNMPVTVETPTDSVKFMDAIQEIMAPLMQQMYGTDGFTDSSEFGTDYTDELLNDGVDDFYAESRDQQRGSDVSTILNALQQYFAEGNSDFSFNTTISTCPSTKIIGTKNASGYIDLSVLVPDYLYELPFDPISGTDEDTQYTVCQTKAGQLTVEAPNAELQMVSVTEE